MQKKRVLEFLKSRGTLGILTLCLVGTAAFATYQISYEEPLEQIAETEMAEQINLVQAELEAETEMENLDAAGQNIDATLQKKGDYTDANELDVDPASLIAETEAESEESEETIQTGTVSVQAQIEPTVNFQEDSLLTWPTAGTVLMDYNMSGTVYFETLNQYKYNPALIIAGQVGNPVVASAKGIVESIETDEETGMTLTMSLGNDYQIVYGQLKELNVSEGDVVEQGQTIGYISEPTKYYCEEGSNLYFQMKKDGQVVDPMLYLE